VQSAGGANWKGWSGIGNGVPSPEVTWAPASGNPGGYARFLNSDLAHQTAFLAPETFNGDWSAGDGVGKIEFDLKVFTAGPASWVVVQLVSLTRLGATQWTGPMPAGPTDWIHYEVPLDSGAWSTLLGSLTDVLPTVSGFAIAADADFSTGTTIGLDNVVVTLPEPAAARLLVLGLGLLRRFRR
jgi:hypothetical protein